MKLMDRHNGVFQAKGVLLIGEDQGSSKLNIFI